MKAYDEEIEVYRFVDRFSPDLMTEIERRAAKEIAGSRSHADHFVRRPSGAKTATLDAEVEQELAGGVDAFMRKVADRLLNENIEAYLSRCVLCSKVTMTPASTRCEWCGYEWA